jgi:hypothetical protein
MRSVLTSILLVFLLSCSLTLAAVNDVSHFNDYDGLLALQQVLRAVSAPSREALRKRTLTINTWEKHHILL